MSDAKTYNLYLFGPNSDVIVHWEKVECDDDETAIKTVQSITGQTPCELWLDDKLIQRWD